MLLESSHSLTGTDTDLVGHLRATILTDGSNLRYSK